MSLTDDFLARLGPLGARNRRNNLGKGARLGVLADEGTRARLFQAKADSAEGEALGQTATITCALGQISAEEDPTDFRLEGVIQWGNSGASAEARFDWKNGTCVRVAGASFSLSCELLPGFQSDALDPDLVVNVDAFVGYVPNGQTMAPTLTRFAEAPLLGPAANFPVPAFAQRALLFMPGITGAGGTIEWVTRDGTVLVTSGTIIDAAVGRFAFEVPNSAAVLRATIAAGVVGRNVLVMWELAL